MSGAKKQEKKTPPKVSKGRTKMPNDTEKDERSSEHVQLMSDVEVQKFTPENENEVAEEVKYGKYEDTKQKYWDEVEMKHHGLVDEHAHHKETAGPQLSQPKSKVPTLYETKKPSATGNFPGHVPYDEIAMKQSGFVDNHCKHMTIADIDHEDAVKEKRHVEFPSVFSGISDEPETISDRSDDGKDEPNQTSKNLKIEANVDTVDVEEAGEDKYREQQLQPIHLPWDELELKEHGLVDKKGHHKNLPEDEIQLHRDGKIDEHGHKPQGPTHPFHLPFDELAMKQSGYVDGGCHHMTDLELNKQTRTVSSGQHVDTEHVDVQSVSATLTSASDASMLSPTAKIYPKRPMPQSEPKLKSIPETQQYERQSYKIKIKARDVQPGAKKEAAYVSKYANAQLAPVSVIARPHAHEAEFAEQQKLIAKHELEKKQTVASKKTMLQTVAAPTTIEPSKLATSKTGKEIKTGKTSKSTSPVSMPAKAPDVTKVSSKPPPSKAMSIAYQLGKNVTIVKKAPDVKKAAEKPKSVKDVSAKKIVKETVKQPAPPEPKKVAEDLTKATKKPQSAKEPKEPSKKSAKSAKGSGKDEPPIKLVGEVGEPGPKSPDSKKQETDTKPEKPKRRCCCC